MCLLMVCVVTLVSWCALMVCPKPAVLQCAFYNLCTLSLSLSLSSSKSCEDPRHLEPMSGILRALSLRTGRTSAARSLSAILHRLCLWFAVIIMCVCCLPMIAVVVRLLLGVPRLWIGQVRFAVGPGKRRDGACTVQRASPDSSREACASSIDSFLGTNGVVAEVLQLPVISPHSPHGTAHGICGDMPGSCGDMHGSRGKKRAHLNKHKADCTASVAPLQQAYTVHLNTNADVTVHCAYPVHLKKTHRVECGRCKHTAVAPGV